MFSSKTLLMKKIKSPKNLSISIFLTYYAFAMRTLSWIKFISDAGQLYFMLYGICFKVAIRMPKIFG